MNNLLISEPPMIVLPSLVIALGNTDKAIMLQQIHYWLLKSKNVKDGHRWVYNSVHDWSKQFPWLSEKTVQRYLRDLEDKGLLITGNYNKAKFDRTKWYRINYSAVDNLGKRMGSTVPTRGTDSPQPMVATDLTYTRDYTETTSETTSSSTEEQEQAESLIEYFSVETFKTPTKAEHNRLKDLILKIPKNVREDTVKSVVNSLPIEMKDPVAYFAKSLINAAKENRNDNDR